MNSPSLLVLGDLHLGPSAPAGAEIAFEALLERHPDRSLVILGDSFDLSAQKATNSPCIAVAGRFTAFPRFAQSIRQHLGKGLGVTLVAGNHDAELTAAGAREAILETLDLPEQAPLAVEPWWLRRQGMHLEHGHIWDPDNAPVHPLAPTEYAHEPLGTALTRQVLAPTGAFLFAHAHQTTPMAGLSRALSELGARAPEVIVRYFIAGARIFWAATGDGPSRLQRQGECCIEAYANAHDTPARLVRELVAIRPVPRQTSARAVFARLYLDRALASVVATTALTIGVVEGEVTALLLAAAGALYLLGSKGDRAHRYSASLLDRIHNAAKAMAPIVDAKIIVFGHTHVPEALDGYVNTGAFGFPTADGRPYLLVDANGNIERGTLDSGNNARTCSLPFSSR